MDKGPLVREQIDAGARFLAEFDKYAPIEAAFWLKEEEEYWYLYVLSKEITAKNFDVGYEEVLRISNALQDPWFDAMQVKLITEESSEAKALAKLRHTYGGRLPPRITDTGFAGMMVDEVRFYPSPILAPTS